MGHKRSAEEQENALEFAQSCATTAWRTSRTPPKMGHGRSIPGMDAAMQTCRDLAAEAAGQ
jgi:hypothetical protein